MTTRRKRTYLALLGIGLTVVVIDRALGPGVSDVPSPADAAPGNSPGTAPAAGGTSQDAGVEAAPFPRDLPMSAEAVVLRDPFQPPARWLAPPPPTEAEGQASGNSRITGAGLTTEAPPRPFPERHHLSAVMNDGKSGMIVLDAQLMVLGQTVDDCVLSAVRDGEALFECADGPVTLSVESGTSPSP